MTSSWAPAILGDLVEVRHGWPFKSEHFGEPLRGRPIVVAIGNFRYTGGFRFGSTAVKGYRDDYPREYELSAGDTLVVMTCQTPGGEILGIPARIPADGRVYLHNQRMGKVVVRAPERVLPDYLYWLFLWRNLNQELVKTASGTKILHTSPSRIAAFRFQLPCLLEQRRIAAVLSALEQKIDVNRRVSVTLEAMARALFKSWFVDFEPVHAKNAGRKPVGMGAEAAALFPAAFDPARTGPGAPIPSGWTWQPLGEVALALSGGTPSRSNLAQWNGDIPWISPKTMKSIHVYEAEANVSRQALGNGTRLAAAGATLVMVRGMGLHEGVRVSQAVCDVAFNQDVKALVPRKIHPTLLLFALLNGQSDLLTRVTSSGHGTGVMPSDILLAHPVVVPPEKSQAALARPLDAMNDKIRAARLETDALVALRDALLPKLLSGELRVPEAERLVQEAV